MKSSNVSPANGGRFETAELDAPPTATILLIWNNDCLDKITFVTASGNKSNSIPTSKHDNQTINAIGTNLLELFRILIIMILSRKMLIVK